MSMQSQRIKLKTGMSLPKVPIIEAPVIVVEHLPPKAENITGKVYDRLTVIRYVDKGKWECLCSCGKTVIVRSKSLRDGDTRSCGCYRLDLLRRLRTPLGFSKKRWVETRAAAGLCPQCDYGLLENGHKVCEECLARNRIRDKNRYKERVSNGICHVCNGPADEDSVRCVSCREKNNLEKRRERLVVKMKVIGAYGGKCKCCGESTIEFLTMDHVNNDGAIHRRTIGNAGQIYKWAIKNNYPNTLQVLCMNCNFAKGIYGVCPHQSKQEKNEGNI